MDTLNESPLPLSWQMPPLERLSQIYVLRLFREAARTQRPLRLMMKDRAELAAVLNADETALGKRKPASLLPEIVERLAELEQGEDMLDCAVARAVFRFGAGFGLNPEECRILLLAVVAAADGYLDNALPSGTSAAGQDLEFITSVATGLPLAAVRTALSPGALLLRSGLVRRHQRNYELSDRLQLIDGMAASFADEQQTLPFEQRWLARVPATDLRLDELGHLRAELELAIAAVKGAFAEGGKGMQILLHGEPGVGKTELARLIAAEAGAAAYLLPDASSEGYPLSADVLLRRPLAGDAYALGDFAVALRQARLRAAAPDAELLRESLEAERRARDEQFGRAIGFNA